MFWRNADTVSNREASRMGRTRLSGSRVTTTAHGRVSRATRPDFTLGSAFTEDMTICVEPLILILTQDELCKPSSNPTRESRIIFTYSNIPHQPFQDDVVRLPKIHTTHQPKGQQHLTTFLKRTAVSRFSSTCSAFL